MGHGAVALKAKVSMERLRRYCHLRGVGGKTSFRCDRKLLPFRLLGPYGLRVSSTGGDDGSWHRAPQKSFTPADNNA